MGGAACSVFSTGTKKAVTRTAFFVSDASRFAFDLNCLGVRVVAALDIALAHALSLRQSRESDYSYDEKEFVQCFHFKYHLFKWNVLDTTPYWLERILSGLFVRE